MLARACPHCKGTGKIAYTSHEFGKVTQGELTCVTCNGEKLVTIQKFNEYHAFQNMWCRCKESPGSNYHPDEPGSKHHWTCQKCGKVTQIG